MSSIIFQAADLRLMAPESIYMIHRGCLGMGGEERTVESTYGFYKGPYNTDKIMMGIYIDGIKRSPRMGAWPRKAIYREIWTRMQKRGDVFLTDKQTVASFLADGIFDGDYDKIKSKRYLKQFSRHAKY